VFDRIVIVDWSAAATPTMGRDSIWAYCDGDSAPRNHPTRAASFAALVDMLRSPGRTLLGFDFPLGYPAGFAAAAHLRGPNAWAATWHHLADHITDDDRNRNNRWAVAADLNARVGELRFWGVPPRHACEHLTIRKPVLADEFRIVEARLRLQGKRPFSTWQLLGSGSVGSQTLTGIPVVHRLRNHPELAARTRVWPLETGLTTDPTMHDPDAIVIAEVWPSAIPHDTGLHLVKDACQVMSLARHYAALDRTGALAECFAPRLDRAATDVIIGEEAWILGVM
jgi:precorrin-8X/cobalt-precorrin-8 methylmutase